MKTIDYIKYSPPRLRHHAYPGLYPALKDIKKSNLIYPEVYDSINWSEIFFNGKAPEYLDIGPGMGKFMIEIALNNSDKNILGLEIRRSAVKWVNKVIEGENIPNAKSIWYNVANGIKFIDANSIKKIFYLFPDPWLKKRHNKRRAFNHSLLDEITRVLRSDGNLYLMTDVAEIDEQQINIIKEHGKFQVEYLNDNWPFQITTNHEEFCILKKIPYVKMVCGKKV